MTPIEKSFQNPRVFSINDEFIVIVGWNNPNDGPGTHADKGTLFIEKTCSSDNGTLWIKKQSSDPKSWDTWVSGIVTGSVVVAPAATETIDTVLLATYDTMDWIINVNDHVSKSQAFKQYARANGTNVDYTQFAVLGDKMSFVNSITSDGTSMTYQVTNNEANSITVKYRRVAI